MPWFFTCVRDPEQPFQRELVGPFVDDTAANSMRDEYATNLPEATLSAVFEKDEGYTAPLHLGFVAIGAETYAIFSDGSQELVGS